MKKNHSKPLFESRSSAKYSRLLSQLFYWLNSPSARTVRYENRFRMEREPRGERKEAGTTYSDGVVCHPTTETTLCGLCWAARQVSSLPPITERIRRRIRTPLVQRRSAACKLTLPRGARTADTWYRFYKQKKKKKERSSTTRRRCNIFKHDDNDMANTHKEEIKNKERTTIKKKKRSVKKDTTLSLRRAGLTLSVVVVLFLFFYHHEFVLYTFDFEMRDRFKGARVPSSLRERRVTERQRNQRVSEKRKKERMKERKRKKKKKKRTNLAHTI